MRTIPMYVTIAEAIRDYSPNAWVINYTNPMTLCVRTLYHVFPKIKAFGCCHEVFGTQTLLTHILIGTGPERCCPPGYQGQLQGHQPLYLVR